MTILKAFFVILLLAVAAPGSQANAQALGGSGVLLSYGPDLGTSGSTDKWSEGLVTIELRPDQVWFGAARPIWSLGVSGAGAVYVAGGIRGDFTLGGFLVTPHFSLALFQDGEGSFDADELIQFRTGIDAFFPITDRTMIGLGYYHVSNAGITSKSADLDVVRLSLLIRY